MDPVKLVIWDLDETFWSGTLSEGTFSYNPAHHDLVLELSRRGIMSSICSKNDPQSVRPVLEAMGIWDYFIFPSIAWKPKGQAIAEIIKNAQLRAENVLFIDDNPSNLAEARYYAPGIQSATPEVTGQLLGWAALAGKPDPQRERLRQYKVLEQKLDARLASGGGNEEFLRGCAIGATLIRDCLAWEERLLDLINRSNQLNFTKVRLTRDELHLLLSDRSIETGCLRVADKYGDYGICGFYARQDDKLLHFVFSCRILDMGVERWLYHLLGMPEFPGAVAPPPLLTEGGLPDWIALTEPAPAEERAAASCPGRTGVMIKGGCDLDQLASYLGDDYLLATEFNYVSSTGCPVHTEHTEILRRCDPRTLERYGEVIDRLPFLDRAAFSTRFFDPEYRVCIYSTLMDLTQGLYRYRDTDFVVPFGDFLTDVTREENWAPYLDRYTDRGLTREFFSWFAENFRYEGVLSPAGFAANLDWLSSRLGANRLLVVLNASEVPLPHPVETERWAQHRAYNGILDRFLEGSAQTALCDVRAIVRDAGDVTDNIRHYTRQKYLEIAGELRRILERPGARAAGPGGKLLVFQILNLPNQQFEKTRYLYAVTDGAASLEAVSDTATDYQTQVRQSLERGFRKVDYRQKEINRALVASFNALQRLVVAGTPFPEFLGYQGISLWQFIMPAVYNGPCKEVFEIIKYLPALIEEHRPDSVVICGNLLDHQESAARQILEHYRLPSRFTPFELGDPCPARAAAAPPADELHAMLEAGNRVAIGAYAAHLQKQRQDPAPERGQVLLASYYSAWRGTVSGDIDRYYHALQPELAAQGLEGVRVELPHYSLINGSKKQYVDSLLHSKRGGFASVFFDSFIEGTFLGHDELASRFAGKFAELERDPGFQQAFSWKGFSFLAPLSAYWRHLFTGHLTEDAIPSLHIARALLAELRPAALMLIYEGGVYSRALTIEAHRAGIPSLALQHGMISDQFKAYLDENISCQPDLSAGFYGFIVPRYTLVWGDYQRLLLTRFGHYPVDAVKSVGNWMVTDQATLSASAPPQALAELRSTWFGSDKKIALLLTSISAAGILEELAAKLAPETYCILIKPHPQEKNGPYYREFFLERGFEVALTDDYLYEAILLSDLVIADLLSTAVCDALPFGKTVYGYQDREPGWTPPWAELVIDLHSVASVTALERSAEHDRAIAGFLAGNGLDGDQAGAARKVVRYLPTGAPAAAPAPMPLVTDVAGVGTAPRPQGHPGWQRTRGNIVAFPHGWQYPVITEEHAYRRICESFPEGAQVAYLAFPWATLIDLINRGQAERAQVYLDALKGMPEVPATFRITVAQHISAHQFRELFELAGITDLFWSHATRDLPELGAIRVHPFPLFPVRCLDAPEVAARGGKGLAERRYLYSFVGAYDPSCYLSEVRRWIAELPATDDALVLNREGWHYEKDVYQEQVLGLAVEPPKRQQLDLAADAYREVLEETVFSLCPSGSGPNSIRLWESLGYGCIPVVMSDRLNLPGSVDQWASAAVFVPETREAVLGLPSRLRSLAQDRDALERLRQAGRRLWEKYGDRNFAHDILQFAECAIGAPPEAAAVSTLPESPLAHQWLDGLRGIEIGPSAHNPFGLNTRNVGIQDEIYQKEQVALAGSATALDIVARADSLPLADESEDFVLTSHVIEHCPDLVKTLVEWFRVVRKGGYLFMIVPHRDAAPSDIGRPLTEWQHVLTDFRNQTTELTEPEAGTFGHCHYHVFSPDSLRGFIERIFGSRLALVAVQETDDKVGNGFTLVYRKEKGNRSALPWEFAPRGRQPGRGDLPEFPKVTAIVSTYNSESFLRGCLADLVGQTLYQQGGLEIIVVDSASPQDEGSIVREFQESYANLVYIRTEQRETIYQAWNRGVELARGSYLTNANTDDRHRRDALEVMAAVLDANPQAGLVYGDCLVTNLPNQDFEHHVRCGYHLRPDFSPQIMLSGCHMGPQPMWRKSLHEELGGFSEQLRSAGDYEFWCRAALQAPFLHIPEFLGLYYENPRGFCNADTDLSIRETSLILDAYHGKFPAPQANFTNNLQYSGPGGEPERYVNIGMVTYNRLEFTRQAIEALVATTDFPYLLTVVDNASRDGTREYLEELRRRGIIGNLVLLDENVGVAKASNLAWSLEPRAAYYLKLDNDIVIQKPGWLQQMADTVDRTPLLGAVAYNFEPVSYPLQDAEGCWVRPKLGNLGGACILIPQRTRQLLGVWCEDYGLYSEEDADYGRRISCAGLVNAYLEDEQIGLHLPAGRAAVIDATTFVAADGVEEEVHAEYRQWKDEQRRKTIVSGILERNFHRYASDPTSLLVESRYVAQWLARQHSPELPQPQGGVAQGRLKVAVYTTEGRDEACPWIRLLLPGRALADSVELMWGALWHPETQGYRLDRTLAAQADLIVVTRFFPSAATADFIRELLAGPVPVLYDTDDLLTGIDPANAFKPMGDAAAPYILELMRRAALVTVSTEELRREYAPHAGRIEVLPNMLDTSLWSGGSRAPSGDQLVIGYAGGFTHQGDLGMVEEALQGIAQKYRDRVCFRFIGCATDALSRLPGFQGIAGVASYAEFAGLLRRSGFDIAIAPLSDSRFNRCKSNVKWLEYSACGFAGVYSDLPPYNRSVEHGVTGLLVGNDASQWFDAIDLLMANHDLRSSLAAQARHKVLAEATPAAQAGRYLEAYRAAAHRPEPAPRFVPGPGAHPSCNLPWAG